MKDGEWYTASAGTAAGGPETLVQRHVGIALQRAKGDRHKARELLIEEAEKNLPLRNALLLPYLHDAAGAAIRRALGAPEPELLGPGGRSGLHDSDAPRRGRPPSSAATPAPPPRPASVRGLQLVGQFNMRNLLSFTLPSGAELRDARRDQVLEAAEEYFSTARDGAMRGRWLKLVGDCMPRGQQRVREVLTESHLSEIYDQAEAEVKKLGEQLRARALGPTQLQEARS